MKKKVTREVDIEVCDLCGVELEKRGLLYSLSDQGPVNFANNIICYLCVETKIKPFIKENKIKE